MVQQIVVKSKTFKFFFMLTINQYTYVTQSLLLTYFQTLVDVSSANQKKSGKRKVLDERTVSKEDSANEDSEIPEKRPKREAYKEAIKVLSYFLNKCQFLQDSFAKISSKKLLLTYFPTFVDVSSALMIAI